MLQPHTAEAPAETAEKGLDIGATIVEHVSNSSLDHPLIHLPPLFGIDISVTKHVLMLWIVAAFVFLVVTLAVRRYLRQDRLVPIGFMNALEFIVEFIRDDDRAAGTSGTNGWTPGRRCSSRSPVHPRGQPDRPGADIRVPSPS